MKAFIKRINLFIVGFLMLISQMVFAQKPMQYAHSHNDYEHKHPLQDALKYGFTSVEADVYLINGELFVSHKYPEKLKGITLKELYLTPLSERIRQNNGRVFDEKNIVFYLMVDIKTDSNETYKALRSQLLKYPEFQGNAYFKIFLSGNRPIKKVRQDSLKLVSIDGRPGDLGKNINSEFMPVVSDNFSNICHWNGKNEISPVEFQKLKNLADKVHSEGKRLRLWATPDNKNAWKTLLDAGIDLINTDKLEGLSKFLSEMYYSK